MPVLDTLSKLAGLASSVKSGQDQDFKYIQAQQQAMKAKKIENLKYLTGRYTDMFFRANNNQALQENIIDTMNDVKRRLPPAFRDQFNAITKTGPFSETKENLRKWKEIKGARPRDLTEEESTDLGRLAATKFAQADYDYELTHFLTKQAPLKKPNVLSLDGENVAYRENDNDVPFVMTTEQFGLKKTCDILGTNYGKALANGGIIQGDETFTTVTNGQKTTYKRAYNLLEPKAQTPVKEGETKEPSLEDYKRNLTVISSEKVSEKAHWEDPLVTEVLTKIVTGGQDSYFSDDDKSVGGRIAKRVTDYIDEYGGKSLAAAEKAINEAVKGVPEFQNIYLAVTDDQFDVESMFEWDYGLSKFARIIPIYGEQSSFRTRDGKELYGIWDKVVDVVHSADGQKLGSYDEAASYFSQHDYSEFVGKERK